MSYHSIHMNHPIKNGFRRSKIQPTTVAELKCLSWGILRGPEIYLNGNTKFQEMPIVAFFFKNGFINKDTHDDIGYNGEACCASVGKRLDKINTQELLNFGTKLMMSGLLKRDWAWILDPTRKPRCARLSKQRIRFSKAIVNQAIKKYTRRNVCWKLRVDIEVIRFWRDYEI